MKKIITVIVLIAILLSFSAAMYYLYKKNAEDPVVYQTEKPTVQTIVKKTVATGSILPKEEVLIKPNISGVIDEIFVEGGDRIQTNDLIAKIRVIPNLSALNSARNSIRSAKIAMDDQTRKYKRQKTLFEKGVISRQDLENAEVAYEQSKQAYNAALQNYEIIKTGSAKGMGGSANTLVRSTVSGMVLDVPVEVGNQVIESNTFNEGTTVAVIADVSKLIFEGKIDESEVGKIKEGMPLEISVGAIEGQKFDAVLNYIAPKGVLENGAIQFEIKGALAEQDTTFIRVGLSANASIILAKAEDVLTIKESLVQYDPDTKKPFVEVETGDQVFERRDLKLGISDGINVEVRDGISAGDRIKVWNKVKNPGN